MGRYLKERDGEWRFPHHSWWRNNPAWVIIGLFVIGFLLWIAAHKLFQ
jgi:hypothetical protein